MKVVCLSQQRGISLIELLIAILLSALLITGIFTIYLSNKKSYQFNEALARIQENGRIGFEYLSRDTRMAGYCGCGRLADVLPANANFSILNSVVGWHNGVSSSSVPFPLLDPVAEGDVLLLQEAAPEGVNAQIIDKNTLTIKESADFKVGDSILISNCTHASVARVVSVSQEKTGETLKITPNLTVLKSYKKYAEVNQLLKLVYYVADTGRKNSAGAAIYALYRHDLTGPTTIPSELIEGVDKMQIGYALKNAPSIVYTADEVPDWSTVGSVQIALLLNSIEAVTDKSQTYTFAGQTYTATDRRLHREWDSVVDLRERSHA